ncbi:hypothetical protein DICSQDRAFT_168357 [Dichomitus squalens LYAD-421 SS1]|uniref:uncharacterized protein n=1 Tax=Dichomitus squalens (strain LYAD-421) TaxID=732165 RepID=UPI000441098C|nr:uncharacterized protein DICSQDRAFT_168357 [Dichomitus squalens LYAD-421 SS1]EJF63466.1 hypothetical protein DICSQDRAFT_168357 [Dichomitus squalens LYAD-421 SS1]
MQRVQISPDGVDSNPADGSVGASDRPDSVAEKPKPASSDEPDQCGEDWERCARILAQHSDEMVQRWKSEIDMLLVFAGLFSAVLTAFNVQSYLLLQPDEQGEMLATLVAMSSQINGYTYSPPFLNATVKVPPGGNKPFTPPSYAIWLNSLWFSALICTLSASSVAITVRQWLHQYSSGLTGTSREVARLRQYRYENLTKWRVATIVTILPALLQLALILFLAGLLVLLWNIHPKVALVASVLVAMLLSFNVAVTVLPAFRADCSYQSPNALCIYIVVQYTGGLIRLVLVAIDKTAYHMGMCRSTVIRDICWSVMRVVRRALRYQGTWGMFDTWEIREKHETHALAGDFDFSLLQKVYEITLDDHLLETTMARCMKSLEPITTLRGCVQFLHTNTTVEDLFGSTHPDSDRSADVRFAQGRRRARYQTFLFKQVLILVPQCAESIGPSSRRAFDDIARKVIALVPPITIGPERHLSHVHSDRTTDSASLLHALAKLVVADVATADAFMKLIANVKQLDFRSGGQGLRGLNADILQSIIDALPTTPNEVAKRLDWRYSLLAGDYFATVTGLIDVIRWVQSIPGAIEAGRAQTLLHSVLTSTEVVLSDTSWRMSADTQHQVMTALSEMADTHPWRSDYHALLPTLSRLVADSSSDRTTRAAALKLIRVVQDVPKMIHQAHLLEMPRLAGDYSSRMLLAQMETADTVVLPKLSTVGAFELPSDVHGKLFTSAVAGEGLTPSSFISDCRRATHQAYLLLLFTKTRFGFVYCNTDTDRLHSRHCTW